jgi:hypothetical protein
MKRNLTIMVVIVLISTSYSFTRFFNDPNAPLSYTGAPNASTSVVRYCNTSGCHQDFALNNAGGAVTVSGLPANYTPGTSYPFTVTVRHSVADRLRWGFAVKAVNIVNNWVVGTFTSTNPNATLKGAAGLTVTTQTRELSHGNSVLTAAANTYTFTGLSWVAPATAGVNDANIRFYIVGNACDGSGDEVGDYVYSTTFNSTLTPIPVTLSNFSAANKNNSQVQLAWQTEQEINSNYFMAEASTDAVNWQAVKQILAAGNSSRPINYSIIDTRPLIFNSSLYYRLKMVDKDAMFRYSDIVSVKLKNEGIVITQASAVPLQKSQDVVFTVHSTNAQPLIIRAANAEGKIIFTSTKNLQPGTNTVQIPAAAVSTAGKFYTVQLSSNSFKQSFKQVQF